MTDFLNTTIKLTFRKSLFLASLKLRGKKRIKKLGYLLCYYPTLGKGWSKSMFFCSPPYLFLLAFSKSDFAPLFLKVDFQKWISKSGFLKVDF